MNLKRELAPEASGGTDVGRLFSRQVSDIPIILRFCPIRSPSGSPSLEATPTFRLTVIGKGYT